MHHLSTAIRACFCCLPHNEGMLRRRPKGWYPVTTLGIVLTVLYASMVPYIVYAQTTEIFPDTLKTPLIFVMAFIILCMLVCRFTDQKPFHHKKR